MPLQMELIEYPTESTSFQTSPQPIQGIETNFSNYRTISHTDDDDEGENEMIISTAGPSRSILQEIPNPYDSPQLDSKGYIKAPQQVIEAIKVQERRYVTAVSTPPTPVLHISRYDHHFPYLARFFLDDPSANIQFFQEKAVRFIGFQDLITKSQASYEYPPTATVTHYSTDSPPTTLFFQRG